MNCAICETFKIGPNTMPCDGCLCANGHMQCIVLKCSGRCSVCDGATSLVRMTFNPDLASVAAAQNGFLSRSAFDGIDTQCNISQAHLTMNVSKESGSVAVEDPQDKLTECSMQAEKETTTQNKKTFSNNDQSMDPEYMQVVQNEEPRTKGESSSTMSNQAQIGALHCGVPHPNGSVNVRLPISIPRKNHSNETAVDSVPIFEDDPNDGIVIHTSELTFVGSTESLSILLAGETPLPTGHKENHAPPNHCYLITTESVVQREALSAKALRDCDKQNTAYSSEVVESSIKSHDPVAYHYYNCPHQPCDFCWNLCQQQKLSQMKSRSVSTDSDPSLKPLQPEKTGAEVKCNLPPKFKTQDYVVMHTTGVGRLQENSVQCVDKSGRPSLDMQMQKVLETIQEEPRMRKVDVAKGNFMKLLIPRMQPAEELPHIHVKQPIPNVNHAKATDEQNDLAMLRLLNAHRALYQPIHHLDRQICNIHTQGHPHLDSREPPPAQFQVVPRSPAIIRKLVSAKAQFMNNGPLPACMLNIPRQPLQCPETTCQRLTFFSHFTKHLLVDHTHLPMERIKSFQCKNFFLDARLAHSGTSRCHLLYLLRDKIVDMGRSEYKDYLPVLVMMSRITLQQMSGVQRGGHSVEFLIIWITGIVPEELPISVTLTVWPRSGKVPSHHLVYSGDMYSIRGSQQGLDVWQSGRMLMLSQQEADHLTNGGKDMLNMQLMVH